MSFTIILAVTRVEGHDEDDYGNLHEQVVERIVTHSVETTSELYEVLVAAEEDAADYGDGFSGTHVLAVYEPENGNQRLPCDSKYYTPEALK